MKRALPLAFVFVAVAGLGPTPIDASSNWPFDPFVNLQIVGEADPEFSPAVGSDGEGGAIIAWLRFQFAAPSGYGIRAARVDALGNVLWTNVEIVGFAGIYPPENLRVVPDGQGGAIIKWLDRRDTTLDVYAQRIDGAGNTLWTPGGVQITPLSTSSQSDSEIVSLGSGEAIVCWVDTRNGLTSLDIFAQRIDGSGTTVWTPNGVLLSTVAGNQIDPHLAADGAGGAVVVWVDEAGSAIYAERINGAGVVEWGPGGVVVDPATGSSKTAPQIVADGYGGVIVAWQETDPVGFDEEIFAQRLNLPLGALLWPMGGIPVSDAAGNQFFSKIVADGLGGAIFTWQDDRGFMVSGFDVYASRFSPAGAELWMMDGIPVCTLPGNQVMPNMVSDSANGVVISWSDNRMLTSTDVYAQRLGPLGSALWTPDGTAICSNVAPQGNPALTTDGRGGAIIAWDDYRSGTADIYAQRVEGFGFLGFPCPTITSVTDHPGDQGGKAIVTWSRSYLDAFPWEVLKSYSVWRMNLGVPPSSVAGDAASRKSDGVPPLVSSGGIERKIAAAVAAGIGEELARRLAQAGWEFLINHPIAHQAEYAHDGATYGDSLLTAFLVIAHASHPAEFWPSSPDTGFSVDNLAPGIPEGFSVVYNYGSNLLSWNASKAADFREFWVYRSDDPNFVVGPQYRVHTTADTIWLDTVSQGWRYHYKLSAVDFAGNESVSASPGLVTAIQDPVIPNEFALYPNAPNPFNPTTAIRFDVPVRGWVTLRIYDVRGRLVSTLASEEMTPGRRLVSWDGRNHRGERVASGVYLCRLEAPGFERTLKMTLLE